MLIQDFKSLSLLPGEFQWFSRESGVVLRLVGNSLVLFQSDFSSCYVSHRFDCYLGWDRPSRNLEYFCSGSGFTTYKGIPPTFTGVRPGLSIVSPSLKETVENYMVCVPDPVRSFYQGIQDLDWSASFSYFALLGNDFFVVIPDPVMGARAFCNSVPLDPL